MVKLRPTETLGSEAMPSWRRRTVLAEFVRDLYSEREVPDDENYKLTRLMLERGAVSGLGLWYVSMDDNEVYPHRLSLLQMLRTVFSHEEAALLDQTMMRTQPPILRIWRTYTKWTAHIDRLSYALDDTMYGICFFVLPATLPAISPFLAGLVLSYLTLPLSLPALALVWWHRDLTLVRLSIFGVVVMGLFGPSVLFVVWSGLLGVVVLAIAWRVMREFLARDLDFLAATWQSFLTLSRM